MSAGWKSFAAAIFVALYGSAAAADAPLCQPPDAVVQFLNEGIAVLVCEDGQATVDNSPVMLAELSATIKDKTNNARKKPLRIAIHLKVEKALREQLAELSMFGPKGSGVVFFEGDFWIGGLN